MTMNFIQVAMMGTTNWVIVVYPSAGLSVPEIRLGWEVATLGPTRSPFVSRLPSMLGSGMFGLVDAYLAAAGKGEGGEFSPTLFAHRGDRHVLRLEVS